MVCASDTAATAVVVVVVVVVVVAMIGRGPRSWLRLAGGVLTFVVPASLEEPNKQLPPCAEVRFIRRERACVDDPAA